MEKLKSQTTTTATSANDYDDVTSVSRCPLHCDADSFDVKNDVKSVDVRRQMKRKMCNGAQCLDTMLEPGT